MCQKRKSIVTVLRVIWFHAVSKGGSRYSVAPEKWFENWFGISRGSSMCRGYSCCSYPIMCENEKPGRLLPICFITSTEYRLCLEGFWKGIEGRKTRDKTAMRFRGVLKLNVLCTSARYDRRVACQMYHQLLATRRGAGVGKQNPQTMRHRSSAEICGSCTAVLLCPCRVAGFVLWVNCNKQVRGFPRTVART